MMMLADCVKLLMTCSVELFYFSSTVKKTKNSLHLLSDSRETLPMATAHYLEHEIGLIKKLRKKHVMD